MKLVMSCLFLSSCTVLTQSKSGANVLPYECALSKDSGNKCRSDQKRWFFDVRRGQCAMFKYNGCGGNSNNFDSRAECRRKCSCHAEINQGIYCHKEYVIRHYWETASKLCRPFWFSGCRGNENRYRSKGQCQSVCGTK